jgi:hypothetical protein
MQGAEGIEAAVAEQAQPLGQLSHATAEQVSDLETSLAVGHPEHGGEAFVQALVVRLVAAAFEFSPLLRAEVNRLHRASLRADFGPFVGSACCCFPAGNVGLVTPSGRREPLRAAQGGASRKRPHGERPAGDVELRSTPFRERAAPGMACFTAVER